MIAPDAVMEAVAKRRDFSIITLRELLEASASGELETQKVFQRHLVGLGWTPRPVLRRPSSIATIGEFAHADEIEDQDRLTVIAERTLGKSSERLPGLLIWAHPDGMPFEGAPDWRHKPFAGDVEGNRMFGWGIADDLSGVAALISVAAILDDLGDETARVVLASTPSKGHASGVLTALDVVDDVGAGIYLHPAESGRGLHDIKAAAPGMLRLRVAIHGRSPNTDEPNHTLYVDQGIDPIGPMVRLLHALQAYNDRRAARMESTTPATMMIGTLSAGESISRMPASCQAVVTFSMPPGESLDETRQAIAETISALADEDPWLAESPPLVDWLFGTTGVHVSESHPLYETVSTAVEEICGFSPRYYGGHIASEIRQPILNHGIPSVGLGPRSGSLAQAGASTDEWLDLDDYGRMIAVCTLAALRWSEVAARGSEG